MVSRAVTDHHGTRSRDGGGEQSQDEVYAQCCRHLTDHWMAFILRERGRAGGSAVAVLWLIVRLTVGEGQRSVRISPRDLADRAGMAPATMYDVLGRLTELGVIEMSKPVNGRTPTITVVTSWMSPEMPAGPDISRQQMPGGPDISGDADARSTGHLSRRDARSARHLSPEKSGRPDIPIVSPKIPSLGSTPDELGNDVGTEFLLTTPTTPVGNRSSSTETAQPGFKVDTRHAPGDAGEVSRDTNHHAYVHSVDRSSPEKPTLDSDRESRRNGQRTDDRTTDEVSSNSEIPNREKNRSSKSGKGKPEKPWHDFAATTEAVSDEKLTDEHLALAKGWASHMGFDGADEDVARIARVAYVCGEDTFRSVAKKCADAHGKKRVSSPWPLLCTAAANALAARPSESLAARIKEAEAKEDVYKPPPRSPREIIGGLLDERRKAKTPEEQLAEAQKYGFRVG